MARSLYHPLCMCAFAAFPLPPAPGCAATHTDIQTPSVRLQASRFKPSHDEIASAVTRVNVAGLTRMVSKAHHVAQHAHEQVRFDVAFVRRALLSLPLSNLILGVRVRSGRTFTQNHSIGRRSMTQGVRHEGPVAAQCSRCRVSIAVAIRLEALPGVFYI